MKIQKCLLTHGLNMINHRNSLNYELAEKALPYAVFTEDGLYDPKYVLLNGELNHPLKDSVVA